MPLDIVILGPPGAGKGTQAELISEDAGIPHINTGDMYRAAVAAGTELGARVKPFMDAGELVPDDLTIAVVGERLSQPDTARRPKPWTRSSRNQTASFQSSSISSSRTRWRNSASSSVRWSRGERTTRRKSSIAGWRQCGYRRS